MSILPMGKPNKELTRSYTKRNGLDNDRFIKATALETVNIGLIKWEDFEYACMFLGLKVAKGNTTQAAKLMGISRSTLNRYMRKYQITVEDIKNILLNPGRPDVYVCEKCRLGKNINKRHL